MEYASTQSLQSFTALFDKSHADKLYYMPFVVTIVSEKFELNTPSPVKAALRFSLDKTVLRDTDIDYLTLSERLFQQALVNRNTEILLIDKRKKYLNQNYYYFPEGIFYLFNKAKTKALGKPQFSVTFDGKVGGNAYQIGLAYRTDWFPSPYMVSYANNIQTIYHGSLAEGILDGLVSACRIYIKEQNLTDYKIKRSKFLNGLILVCAVRGEDFTYGGSFQETLEEELVKKQAKKIVQKLVYACFQQNKEIADSFLWRFDETHLTSGMY